MCRLLCVLATTLCVWSAQSAQGTSNPGQSGEGTLHLIIACDLDDSDLGEGFEINEGLIRSGFINAVDSRSLRFYAPWGHGGDGSIQLTGQNLLDEVDKVKVGPNDTLMVYLACHGFWDKDEHQHWFRFENDSDSALERKTLIDRIKSRTPRLGLLVTDACTNYEKLPPQRVAFPASQPPFKATASLNQETAPLYQALFFDQEGFLDLSSSSPGQFTLYYNNYRNHKTGDPLDIGKKLTSREIPGTSDKLEAYSMTLNGEKMKGGLLTESMMNLLETNRDQKFDWKKFADLPSTDVQKRFHDEKPDGQLKTAAGTILQDTQTVAVLEYPQSLAASSQLAGGGSKSGTKSSSKPDMKKSPDPGSGPATNKFGVSVVVVAGGGLTVTSVRDGSTAARHGVNVDDVIQKINNQLVNTPDELEAALTKAPATFRITIGGESFVVRP